MSNHWRNADGPRSLAHPLGAQGTSAPDSDTNSHRPYSVGAPTESKFESLATFFGEPQRRESNRKDYYPVEYEDYGGAFTRGYGNGDEVYSPNGYMSRVLIEKVKASQNWMMLIAPFQHHKDGGLVFTWDTLIYNQHMLDREPEESTPRLLTSNRSSGSATMVRYGIALMLESNFAGTEVGRQTYLANLEQIRIATVETCSYGVMISILEHLPYTNSIQRAYNNEQRDKAALDRLFKSETSLFGIVHKESSGYSKMRSLLTTEMSRRIGGCEGNFTVIPRGMGVYLHGSGDSKFYLDGRSSDRDNIKNVSGQTVVESRSFSNGEYSEGHDPCFRHQTIGGFQSLDDAHVCERDISLYRTNQMDFQGYDESADDWYTFRYSHLYDKAGVWNFQELHAPLTDRIGRGWAYDTQCYTYGQLYRRNANLERMIDKVHLLKFDKQQEFLATLQLLPEDDSRSNPRSGGESYFERNKFEGMYDGALAWDTTYSVPQRRSFKRKQDGIVQTYDNELASFEEFSHTKNNAYDYDERTIESRFETADTINGDEDEFETQAVKYVHGEHGRVAKYALNAPIVKRLRRPELDASSINHSRGEEAVHSLAARVLDLFFDVNANSTAIQTIAEYAHLSHTNSTDLLLNAQALAAERKAEAILAFAQANINDARCLFIEYVVSIGHYVCRMVHAIVHVGGLDDSSKLILLSELRRVVIGILKINDSSTSTRSSIRSSVQEYATIVKNTVLFPNVLAAAFAPFAIRYDIESSLRSLRNNYTKSERMLLEKDSDIYAASSESCEGIWDIDGDGVAAYAFTEDGKISLDVGSNTTRISLPSDIFATTLTDSHAVLFAIDTSSATDLQTLNFTISNGLSRTRGDSLYVSICLSLIASGVITSQRNRSYAADPLHKASYDAAFGAYEQKPLIAVNVKRIKRFLKTYTVSNPLLSQMHLSQKIRTSLVILSELAYDETYMCCPVERSEDERKTFASDIAINLAITNCFDMMNAADSVVFDKTVRFGYKCEHASASLPRAPLKCATGFVWTKVAIRDIVDRASLVSGEFFRFCVDNDIPVPLSVTTWRPSKTYNMGSMIRLQTGDNGAAKTFYKNPDFMMADNAAQKMIYGHFTLYSKTIVMHPEKVIIGHNVFCESYVGGNGVQVWDPLNEDHLAAYRDNNLMCDMFVTYGVMKDSGTPATRSSWRSMTGTVPKSLGATSSVNDLMFYPGCAAVSEYWGWKSDARDYFNSNYRATTDSIERKFNVICMQEVQIRRDPLSQAYTSVIRDAGHWSDKVYPGCAAVRNGQKSTFDTPNYHDTKVMALI